MEREFAGGNWVWSEAVIAPMTVTPAQAAYIVRTLPGGARELPSKISTIRFASIRIGDSHLFPDAYEGVLRRGRPMAAFGALVLRPLNADGTMQLSFRPGRLQDGRESIEFRLRLTGGCHHSGHACAGTRSRRPDGSSTT